MNPAQLPHLHTFLAVARLRSFTAAARELGVSTPAVSQAVRLLEEQLRLVLLVRTTRSVSLTEEGRRLVETAGPPLGQTLTALSEISARPGETVARLRLSVPSSAIPYVIEPVLPELRKRHPRIQVEIVAEDRFVDIVAEGYDAGVRLSEAIERDMVQVRLTKPFRFVVVGAPSYFEKHGTPERPEDLLEHECITFRSLTSGALYAWELERGKRNWRVPVRGGITTNDTPLRMAMVERGLGLTYAFEPQVAEALRARRMRIVLEPYAAEVPGFFLYFPSRAQSSPALRLFVDLAKELTKETRARRP